LRDLWRTPAGRGFILLAAMTACYGFASNAQGNIVTNYLKDVLQFSDPQFGYFTAIREIGGLVLIFLTALLYRVALQKVTAGALVILGVGYALFITATNFVNLIPWVLLTSFGLHTVLQTQYSLGMSLTTQDKSGSVLGRIASFGQAGTLVAYVLIFIVFQLKWLSYTATFITLGVVAVLGGVAIFRFPHLHDGEPREVAAKRERIVFRRAYKYYYWLNLLDGGRQQIFFSFGLLMLLKEFHFKVPQVSLLLIVVTFVSMMSSAWIGRFIDKQGERRSLSIINVLYIVALVGFALSGNVWLACFFYLIYAVISPFSYIASAIYLRKIAVPADIASSMSMGVTLLHATALVVPVVAGYILHFTGLRVPFYIACGFALANVVVTLGLNPVKQRCAERVALDEAVAAATLMTER
jgi:predicted MFS family arabinose efflux permease